LCGATGLDERADQIVALFRELADLCDDRDIALPPRWSAVGADCTPYEFSLEIRPDRLGLRFLVEAQADPASPQTYWSAADRLNAWLAESCGADLGPLRLVEDLFAPIDDALHAATAHAVGFGVDSPPLFKLYLNPLARGRTRAAATVSEALNRLGFEAVVPPLLEMCGPEDVFSHFSLDLFAGPTARVKIYIKHFNATPAELDARCAAVDPSTRGEWATFVGAVLGEQSTLSRRPVYSAYHLTAEAPDRLQHTALHLPIQPYIDNDLVAHRRIRDFLVRRGLPTEAYGQCLNALASRPLEREQGIHGHVSYQRIQGSPRVAVYFGSRAYHDRYGWLSLDPQRGRPELCWPSPVRA
jgi:hypothetical protein